ncbi:MAG: GNAT family N-acetyltransferase [Bacteroidia bacterium]|nr:GNAT family N-acetyltransferase [Bacteroidia bacterium]NNF31431.1 GNAT family N-acetyltransferase [Flavobacteriaceae bacterium]NNJ80895.1 GNAT family N-acetyltransferase [Flavobacteriaceae bacterium]NNK54010.1 GNAT family N-acetyltransferase [Flavobacteriaceae bacterium]NNM07587.1 GNAT family N-acetyltransferase [Flavobacteriaceae bacterium]
MIRKAKPLEIDAILAITRACAVKMIADKIYQWNEWYPHREAFETDIRRGELFVITSQDTITGCIVISSLKDEVYNPVQWLTEDGLNYYIHRLAIHPDFQHQGFAKKLMDFAEEYIRKNEGISVRLDTFSKNTRNQRFYEARGYTRLEEIYFPKQSEYPFYCYELPL